MSNRIVIDDNGDEVVHIRINDEIIARVDHETYGWSGMSSVIETVEAIAESFGIPVTNNQNIV